eukprot:TRINITY_DN7254_c0_g1_i1.p1 TRINITY_DN7254_c0_g1~~TRINITY_DN7254_c0_g1_i1.p1  ORF type:complete len:178 (-),score=61.92 TRINITY_DN7254_c0_g1_i1:103-636(-)
MRRFFGGSKPAAPAVSLDEATQRVDARATALDTKVKNLEAELVDYRERIKKTRPGPQQNALKQKALRVLKQKKMYEQQLEQLMGQSFNMESANFAVQSVKDTLVTVSAMKEANTALRGQLKHINIDDVEDMQDDMADLLELNNEIQVLRSSCAAQALHTGLFNSRCMFPTVLPKRPH